MNWRTLVVLAFLCSATACHRRTSAVAPPPPAPAAAITPAALREGDSAFDSGDFARAARSYEIYLANDPKPDAVDRILFRFGIAQMMSGVAARELASSDVFNQLIQDFPQSEYVPPARMVLSLRAEIAQLKAESTQLKANTDKAVAEANKAAVDLKARDDKIKQLNDELDKLKKIDSERRRTP